MIVLVRCNCTFYFWCSSLLFESWIFLKTQTVVYSGVFFKLTEEPYKLIWRCGKRVNNGHCLVSLTQRKNHAYQVSWYEVLHNPLLGLFNWPFIWTYYRWIAIASVTAPSPPPHPPSPIVLCFPIYLRSTTQVNSQEWLTGNSPYNIHILSNKQVIIILKLIR